MIGKLLGGIVSLVVYACVATILSQAILAGYFARAWHVDRDKLTRMLAIAQGVDLEAMKEQAAGRPETPLTEQPSYEQVVEARALGARDLELREQSLKNSLERLQLEQRKLAAEHKHYLDVRESFEKQLLAMQKGAAASGKDDVRRTLETIKPKQAKEFLQQMLEQKELDDVVALLSGMSETKQAKIIAEFKTDAEMTQLGEVLRRIRQGLPAATMADNAQNQLMPTGGRGL